MVHEDINYYRDTIFVYFSFPRRLWLPTSSLAPLLPQFVAFSLYYLAIFIFCLFIYFLFLIWLWFIKHKFRAFFFLYSPWYCFREGITDVPWHVFYVLSLFLDVLLLDFLFNICLLFGLATNCFKSTIILGSSSRKQEKDIWGGWALPSMEQPWKAEGMGSKNEARSNSSAGRTKKVVRINIE